MKPVVQTGMFALANWKVRPTCSEEVDMTETINWTLNVAVVGGPKVSGANTLDVEAYDKVGVVVQAGSQSEVEVQPGTEGQVQFLLLSSDHYGSELTYRVNDESGQAVALDALQLFVGTGAVSLLGQSPKTIHFDNQMADDAAIRILVGRRATTGEDETADDPEPPDTPDDPDPPVPPDPSPTEDTDDAENDSDTDGGNGTDSGDDD
jgi:hypothetical protein